jgi:hypothetical protein
MENVNISSIENKHHVRTMLNQIRKYTTPTAMAVSLVLAGCGGDDEEVTPSPTPSQDAGTDAPQEAGFEAGYYDATPPDTGADATVDAAEAGEAEAPFTKAQLAVSLTEDVMGYEYNTACEPIYTDVDDNRLCHSTNIIAERNKVTSGNFNPDSTVTRRQLAELVSTTLGFLNDPEACPNLPVSQIETTHFGAFCRKNVPITSPGEGLNPDETVKTDVWAKEILPALNAYFGNPSTRLSISENAYKVILGESYNPNTNCVSLYGDVQDNSPECHITTKLFSVGALGASPDADAGVPLFKGQNPADWATIMKVYVESSKPDLNPNLYQNVCTAGSTVPSCAGAYRDTFACTHAEALCNEGYIQKNSMTGTNIAAIPTNLDSSRLGWNLQMKRPE